MAQYREFLATGAEFPAPTDGSVANKGREGGNQRCEAENPGRDSIDGLSGGTFV